MGGIRLPAYGLGFALVVEGAAQFQAAAELFKPGDGSSPTPYPEIELAGGGLPLEGLRDAQNCGQVSRETGQPPHWPNDSQFMHRGTTRTRIGGRHLHALHAARPTGGAPAQAGHRPAHARLRPWPRKETAV